MKDVIHSQFSITESHSDANACNAVMELRELFLKNDRLEALVDFLVGDTDTLLPNESGELPRQETEKVADKPAVITGMRTTKSGE